MIETYLNNHDLERFELTIDDELAAWMDYKLTGGTIALNHTEVVSSFRGRGLAGDLAAYALAHARLRGLRVKANCSYVAAFINRQSANGEPAA